MYNHLEMQTPSNPKSTDNSSTQPDFPNLGDINNVTESRSMFVPNNDILMSPNWKNEIKKKIPLPPRHKPSSLILAPSAHRRITLTLDEAIDYELKYGRRKMDPSMDKKYLRRTISNRLSAQRSRIKKSQYIDELEKMAKELEDRISVLNQQVERYKEQRKQLQLQNESLHKLVEIRSSKSRISEIEIEQKRLEICKLKELAKTLNNRSHDSLFGPGQMQDLMFNPPSLQPYSLQFYQNGLQRFESNNQFSQLEQLPGSALVQLEPGMAPTYGFEEPREDPQPGFMTEEQPVEMLAQDEVEEAGQEDIDQYLDLDELNLDPAAGV